MSPLLVLWFNPLNGGYTIGQEGAILTADYNAIAFMKDMSHSNVVITWKKLISYWNNYKEKVLVSIKIAITRSIFRSSMTH